MIGTGIEAYELAAWLDEDVSRVHLDVQPIEITAFDAGAWGPVLTGEQLDRIAADYGIARGGPEWQTFDFADGTRVREMVKYPETDDDLRERVKQFILGGQP